MGDSVFIVGCGDIGTRLARRWLAAGRRVAALCRSPDRADGLRALGVQPVFGDLDDVFSLRSLRTAGELVYYLAPPRSPGRNDIRMRTFVGAITAQGPPARIVLLSTTSVYGDHQGDWVDEQSPPRPATARAYRRLDAEKVARAYGRAQGVPVIVLRVAGIYAEDRLPVQRLVRGEPLVCAEQSPYTNRIHAEDLVTVLVAAAERGRPDTVYNVSDGEPLRMTQYFFAVADALGLPRPPTVDLDQAVQLLSPAMMSYLKESRRLSNHKMLHELNVHLKYPSLESGLCSVRAAAPLATPTGC